MVDSRRMGPAQSLLIDAMKSRIEQNMIKYFSIPGTIYRITLISVVMRKYVEFMTTDNADEEEFLEDMAIYLQGKSRVHHIGRKHVTDSYLSRPLQLLSMSQMKAIIRGVIYD